MLTTAESIEIEKLLSEAAKNNASDIHLSVTNPPYFRIDKKLIPIRGDFAIDKGYIDKFVDFLLDEEQKKVLQDEREVVIGYTSKNNTRFRVHVFYQSGNISISIRIIASEIMALDKLGLPDSAIELSESDKGLLIIAGPLDSGKSVTIGAFVQQINNTRSDYIVTLENPIEYIYNDDKSIIDQREIGNDVHSYSQALDNILKEDVNVLVIPDIDDAAVASRAFDIAESNRLVIMGIDSEGVTKTISKIVNFFPENVRVQVRRQLAENLTGLISQILIPKMGGGLVVASEVLLPTRSVKAVIREGEIDQLNNVIQTSKQDGMVSLEQSLSELVHSGDISHKTALKYAHDKESLKS